ncbi:MAG: hypothetical protein F6K19_19780 [Cyanothece sp. SIO1E1]|nr:hypothetical protein [Cyanothece sp. SIO1E1]
MKKMYLVGLLCLGLFYPAMQAQFAGLWTVQEVKVGTEMLTPVAKWFQFEEDESLASGNGGVRNMIGSYELDEEKGMVQFRNESGQADPMGPFAYKVDGEGMQMEREEEGQAVVVVLKRASNIPLAPWDEMVGFWGVKEGEAPGQMQSIFIRWDRRFVSRTPQGRKTGIWHIDGHQPILKLISDSGDAEDSQWTFEFLSKTQLRWKRKVAGQEETLLLVKQE